jgi:hypothetical protein
MTIRDLAHLLLTARDLDQDVKISSGGYKSHITRVEFVENGEFVIGSNGYNIDKVTVTTEIEVKSPYDEEPKIF